jgi:hypothetical protein
MTTRFVDSSGGSKSGRRERTGVFAVAGLIVTVLVAYVAFNAKRNQNEASLGLLPYQALVSSLPDADQQQFQTIREGLTTAESIRARTKRWPEAMALGLPGPEYRWTRLERGPVVNYLGTPVDPAQPAWLLEIQEPEPGMPPDPAPNDEEHHRLPDGTTLHVYVWTHRLGGQVASDFVAQPQNTGWIEVFSQVPNPVYAIRR